MPTVSIVVPCYNQGHFLHEALASVEAQTFKDFEIIIVDDGSTFPDTIRIINELDRSRFRVVRTQNQGLADARNNGIREAKGKYILPLDADDKIGPKYLERAVAILEKQPDIGIVYCEAEFFGAKNGRWELRPYKFPEILVYPCIFASSVFRRSDWERVGGFSNKFIFGWEDYDFWLSLIERGAGVYQIPEVLFFYRQHEQASMIGKFNHDKTVMCYKMLFHRHRELYSNNIDALFSELVPKDPGITPEQKLFCAQVFFPRSAGHSDQYSEARLYPADSWERLSFEIPDSWPAGHTLRFDPSNGPALLSIAELTIKSAVSGEVYWQAKDQTGFKTIQISGTTFRLAEGDKLVLLSYGDDPQLYIPELDITALQKPLRFEIVLHGTW